MPLSDLRTCRMIKVSQDVANDFPDIGYAPGFQNIAGLLSIPLSSSGRDFIVFFRRGQVKHIHWVRSPISACVLKLIAKRRLATLTTRFSKRAPAPSWSHASRSSSGPKPFSESLEHGPTNSSKPQACFVSSTASSSTFGDRSNRLYDRISLRPSSSLTPLTKSERLSTPSSTTSRWRSMVRSTTRREISCQSLTTLRGRSSMSSTTCWCVRVPICEERDRLLKSI